MNKLIFSLAIIFALNTTAQASCLDQYKAAKENSVADKIATKLTGTGGTAVVLGVLTATPELMMAGFPVIAIGGSIMLGEEVRYNRMINLIEDATAFSKSSGTIKPGKRLRRFYNKVENGEVSMMDIANSITRSNEDLSLCSNNNLKFYHRIKKEFKTELFLMEL